MFYEIKYTYKGKKGTAIVIPVEGYESQFFESCVNRIDSLVHAGAKITDTTMHHTK